MGHDEQVSKTLQYGRVKKWYLDNNKIKYNLRYITLFCVINVVLYVRLWLL